MCRMIIVSVVKPWTHLNRSHSFAIEWWLVQGNWKNIFNWIIGTNFSVRDEFRQQRIRECFFDRAYLEDTVAVLNITRGIIPSVDPYVFFWIAGDDAYLELYPVRKMVCSLLKSLRLYWVEWTDINIYRKFHQFLWSEERTRYNYEQ